MDLHIAVLEDFKVVCPQVKLTEWCLTRAGTIMGKPLAFPIAINYKTWSHITPKMIEEFQREYDGFLRSFDGFVVGFASVFAMVFEKYNKPIIMLNAVRYDLPFMYSNDMQMRAQYHACLYRLHNAKRLWMVSNNRCDQSYTAKGLGLTPRYIPTLGTYTGMKYTPSKETFLCYSEKRDLSHPLIVHKRGGLSYSDIASFKGIIHIPYEAGLTMSMFEHFSAGMPMFFPSRELWLSDPVVWSTTQYWTKHPQNLEEFDRPEHWITTSCLYDVFKSPNTHIFDSIEHLYQLLETFVYVPEDRTARNESIKKQWADLLAELPSGKTGTTHYELNDLSWVKRSGRYDGIQRIRRD